mmetsp:Transcript_9023/g.22005  ORF Transcript_9023/g.22005 Transcript_9023/m.22005 type:complete len:374 (+) Transcript_9023:40-1161(+)
MMIIQADILPIPASLLTVVVTFLVLVTRSHSLSTPKPRNAQAMKNQYAYQPDRKTYDGARILSLHRYAIKGLSGDSAPTMKLNGWDGTFEDDRRFALLYDTSGDRFDDDDPSWLHKENFLCAFTAPELLATLDTEYRIETARGDCAKRLLTVWDRKLGRSSTPLLGPTDLAHTSGREETSRFFTELCGKKVQCVVANNKSDSADGLSNRHVHQFGNTSSGVKNNKGDTRTIHIINENTVKQFSEAVYGIENWSKETSSGLSATRFRPNIVVNHLEPWAEFDLIGKTIEVVSEDDTRTTPVRFRVVSRTVRCAGVGVDPFRPEQGLVDVPNLLSKHFPEHGPYLGVYAVMDNVRDGASCGGSISVGDTLRVVEV